MTDKVSHRGGRSEYLISGGAWLVAISLVLCAGYIAWQTRFQSKAFLQPAILAESKGGSQETALPATQSTTASTLTVGEGGEVNLPVFVEGASTLGVSRRIDVHTIIPARPREEVITYTVEAGDSVFSIAKSFNLKPESVLWANYVQLKDSPDMLSPGMKLNIPPVNGVYYEWKEGDTLSGVAAEFKATADDIINWSGNHLDLTNPVVQPGEKILVPNGKREFVQWVIPTIPRGNAGVNRSAYGPGACAGGYEGAYGTGTFVWPTLNHFLSGNDYWSGHLGIDIAGATGAPIFASDSGVIVFAGLANGGYGYMVMIDHGNGYQTLYAHMSAVGVYCGQSVYQGGTIGAIGSTGNSTGSHLHFEIRYMGGFINPWYMLPAP